MIADAVWPGGLWFKLIIYSLSKGMALAVNVDVVSTKRWDALLFWRRIRATVRIQGLRLNAQHQYLRPHNNGSC